MNKTVIYTGRLLTILALSYLFFKLKIHFHELPGLQWNFRTSLYVSGAVIFCGFNVVISGFIWTLLLRGAGAGITITDGYVIFGLSQIGKYLPGNIFHYAGRVALGREKGIPLETLIFSVGAETLIVLLTSLLIAIVGIVADFPGLGSVSFMPEASSFAYYGLLSLLVLGACSLLISDQIRCWFHKHFFSLSLLEFTCYFLVYLGAFLGYGVLIWVVSKGVWNLHSDLQWYHFAWGFSLAWVVGFLVPGAPGGIGIREAILVGIWSGEMGEGLALGLALFLRIATGLGDLVSFAIAYSLKYFTLSKNS